MRKWKKQREDIERGKKHKTKKKGEEERDKKRDEKKSKAGG
jgi:hypothetical protein